MENNIYFTCLFVKDQKDLLLKFPPKHKNTFAHHSTIKYKPEDLKDIELGKVYKIKVLAIYFDEKGDAVVVENNKSEKKIPHTTISVSEVIRSNYSNEMLENAKRNNLIHFFENPIEIKMVEGYVDYSRNDFK